MSPISNPATIYSWAESGATAFSGSSPAVAAWTDLDLSSIIGAKSALVMLSIGATNAATKSVAFRKNGDTDEYYDAANVGGAAGSSISPSGDYQVFFVITDAAGIVEWISENTSQTTTIKVLAWIEIP